MQKKNTQRATKQAKAPATPKNVNIGKSMSTNILLHLP